MTNHKIMEDEVLHPGVIVAEVSTEDYDFCVEERNSKYLFIHIRVKRWGASAYKRMMAAWIAFCSDMKTKGLHRLYCHAPTEQAANFQQMFGFIPDGYDIAPNRGRILRQLLEL